MLIKGKTITLIEKAVSGLDAFGNPIFTDSSVLVDNVLIEPLSYEQQISDLSLYGKITVYQLHIPKEDTHIWEDTEVEFYGKRFRTIGPVIQYQTENCPLAWDRKIKVEHIE